MKIISVSPASPAEKKNDFLERIQHTVGTSAQQKEIQAQDIFIGALGKSLDNRYTLLRSVRLDGLEVPIPLTLVGPTGIHIIYASPLKGLFHVKENSWEKLDERTNKYQPQQPNLVVRVHEMAQSLQAYLSGHNFKVETVEPVLFFSDLGFHVDTVRPAVRVLMADAAERFIAGLLQAPPVFPAEMVQRMVTLLTGELLTPPPPPVGDARREDAFSFREVVDEKQLAQKRQADRLAARSKRTPLSKRIPLTDRQIALLGILIFGVVLLLFTAVTITWLFFLR